MAQKKHIKTTTKKRTAMGVAGEKARTSINYPIPQSILDHLVYYSPESNLQKTTCGAYSPYIAFRTSYQDMPLI